MRLLLLIISLIAFTANAQENLNGKWLVENIAAASLKKNALGYVPDKQVGVYLPPSYFSSKKNYPVVYFLEGYGGRIDESAYVATLVDSLIKKNQIPEMIFIQISGDYSFRGSFYVNSPVTGNWEDFVVKDVTNFVDTHYRTISDSESRAIVGMSMGGFGVLNLAMLHPDIYALAYAMSPGLFDEEGLANCQIFRDGGTIDPILSLITKLDKLSTEEAHKEYLKYVGEIKDWNIEFTLAYGMAFAPNTKKAPYFDYPVSIVNGDTIVEKDKWEKWERGFGGLEEELTSYKNNLNKLKLLSIDCGYNDVFKWIVDGSVFYANLLRDNKISHSFELNQGDHGSMFVYQMYHKVLPTVAAGFKYENE
ncbi:alpha/beta hydrolase [Marinifilum breve]|nr:alpha/beta hydrolase-fold protein [Marinifilum breve]